MAAESSSEVEGELTQKYHPPWIYTLPNLRNRDHCSSSVALHQHPRGYEPNVPIPGELLQEGDDQRDESSSGWSRMNESFINRGDSKPEIDLKYFGVTCSSNDGSSSSSSRCNHSPSSSSTTTRRRTSSSKEEDLKIEADVDGAEARSILAANPQDLSPAEIVSGTKKLTKFKSVIRTNLKAQGMFVDQKKAEITEISSKNNPYQERNDDSSSTLKEKMNTLQWLKTVQANMRQEYKAVMEKIEEMEKALESMAEEVRIKS
mmetsp:Transcript_3109/g.4913  ORF Transcript_3109/g.4913 Transcript_3109/m.4913 type:complete len:261 (+) Transcript_3109:212-994(+)